MNSPVRLLGVGTVFSALAPSFVVPTGADTFSGAGTVTLTYNNQIAVFYPRTGGGYNVSYEEGLNPTQMQSVVAPAFIYFTFKGVNFSTASIDRQIPVVLPTGLNNYAPNGCDISQATGTLTTATFGVFTAPAGAGATLFPITACTVTSSADATLNNMQVVGAANSNIQSYNGVNNPIIYFRVITPQPGTVFANVTIALRVLA